MTALGTDLSDFFVSFLGSAKTVYAKTGSLSGVSTFSGYILNPDKEPIAFSILMNGYKGSSLPFRELQDKIVSQLAEIK